MVQARVPERAFSGGRIVVFKLEEREIDVAIGQIVPLGSRRVDFSYLLQTKAVDVELLGCVQVSRRDRDVSNSSHGFPPFLNAFDFLAGLLCTTIGENLRALRKLLGLLTTERTENTERSQRKNFMKNQFSLSCLRDLCVSVVNAPNSLVAALPRWHRILQC
jgi:hypothetical protein